MKLLKLFLLLILCSNLGYGQDKAEHLGLVSELIYIKYTSENIAREVINDTLLGKGKQLELVSLYNKTKILCDQIIVQLISDCKRKNKLKYFRKLDKLFVEKTITQINATDLKKAKLKGYIKNLKKLNEVHKELLDFFKVKDGSENPLLGVYNFNKTLSPSVEELTGVLSFISATIKDIKAANEKKVEKITNILDGLRLSPLQDLKTKKEEKAKKI